MTLWKNIQSLDIQNLLIRETIFGGFVVEDSDNNETLLSDDYFSSSIVIALDEIATFLGKPDIKEGQRVRITIETE